MLHVRLVREVLEGRVHYRGIKEACLKNFMRLLETYRFDAFKRKERVISTMISNAHKEYYPTLSKEQLVVHLRAVLSLSQTTVLKLEREKVEQFLDSLTRAHLQRCNSV